MRNSRKCLFLIAALITHPVAQAQAKSIEYNARISAKYPEVANGGTVAVLDFKGADGDAFAATLASALQGAQLDGVPVFTIRTGSLPSTSSSLRVQTAAAVKAGQSLGAATVMTGSVTTAAVRATDFVKQEQVCGQSSGFLKCEQYVTKNVPCQKVIGDYAVTPRAITVSGSRLIFTQPVTVHDEYTMCNGQLEGNNPLGSIGSLFGIKSKDEANIATPEALLAALRTKAADEIRQLVAPYNKTMQVDMKSRTRGMEKAANKEFGNAIAFANAGRMDRACSIFEVLSIDPANQSNTDLLYNMGVCQEVLLPDEPARALEYYARADQLLSRPDKQISEAYVRMKGITEQSRSIK